MSGRNVDLDKFRLRSFVEKLIAIGEMEVHEQPVSLADLSAVIESSPKAKCFKRVGVEQYEMVAAVSGSRRRLAAAFGTDERNVIHEYMRRMNDPQPVVEVPSSDAPVHQVVVTGDAIDLTSCRSISSTSSTARPISRRPSTTASIPPPVAGMSAAAA